MVVWGVGTTTGQGLLIRTHGRCMGDGLEVYEGIWRYEKRGVEVLYDVKAVVTHGQCLC